MRALLIVLLVLLSGCSWVRIGSEAVKDTLPRGQEMGAYKVGNPYKINGDWYYPQESFSYDETGIASWYGPGFHNKRTANGERFNQREMTAAHRTLQMPSFVRVTNLTNGKSVVVRINDRGPYAKGRIIDVSEKAAELLEFKGNGVARVRVQLLPEASRQVAQAAREGRSWHGSIPQEVTTPAVQPSTIPMASAPRPYEPSGAPVPAHQIGKAYYPDPVVTQRDVPVSTQLYIQAGSFGDMANAQRMVSSLSSQGRAYVADVQVGGVTYHRVRVGPYNTLGEADAALARVSRLAPEARIVVN